MTDVIVSGYQGPPGPMMPAVRLATVAALPAYTAENGGLRINANGLLSIDGVPVVVGTDVLVQHEGGGTSADNRICTVVTAGDASTRAFLLFRQNIPYKIGFPIAVGLGTNAGKIFQVTTDGTIIPGTTAISWQQAGGGGGGSDDQTAAEVPFTPAGSIAATNVQTAIEELANETVQLAGAQNIAGPKTFTDATSPIISAKIGPTSGQQHALPGVTSSTLAVLGAAQSWTALQTHVIDDTTSSGNTDVMVLRHTHSEGNGANNIAAGLLFQTEDSAGNIQDTARIAGVLTTATSTSETSAMGFEVWSSGAMSEKMRLGSDGGLVIGSTVALGAVGIGLLANNSIYGRNSTNNGWLAMLNMNNNQTELGSTFGTTQVRGSSITILATGSIFFFPGSAQVSTWTSSAAQWGTGDASASAADFTHRGSNITGPDAAGKTLTWVAPRGTGAGAAGIFRIAGGQVGSTGSTQHTQVDYADFQDTGTDNEAAYLIRVRKGGGVYAKERVKLVSGANVAASTNLFLSVSP